jgi:hypothetical protein
LKKDDKNYRLINLYLLDNAQLFRRKIKSPGSPLSNTVNLNSDGLLKDCPPDIQRL